MENVIGVLFFLIFMALIVAAIAFWIISLIEVVKIPDHQFKAASTEKIVWVLIVVLAGWIGALIWRFVKRNDVLAAAGSMPPMNPMNPSPGYGVGPGAGAGGGPGYEPTGNSGTNPAYSQGSGGASTGAEGGSGGGPPPGWYPEPGGASGLRWWDGTRWTEDRR